MAEEKKERKQVNIDFTEFPELWEAVTEMATEDGLKVGPFVRSLVSQEKQRRGTTKAQSSQPVKKNSRSVQPLAA